MEEIIMSNIGIMPTHLINKSEQIIRDAIFGDAVSTIWGALYNFNEAVTNKIKRVIEGKL